MLRPWCALEFGDVAWCTRTRAGGYRTADLWLSFPAEGKEREALFKLTKGEELDQGGFFDDLKDSVGGALQHGPGALPGVLLSFSSGPSGDGQLPAAAKRAVEASPSKVRMQEKGATFTRIALLCMIALGLSGAICLLLYLAIKLILAGLLALILLLLAPAMLLAPAFGESGRATFLAWLKRLAGAIVAKLIYALLLALVVVAATALAALDIGWFGAWLLQTAFWWGILIKRKELTGFLTVGQQDDSEGGGRALRWYGQARVASALAGSAAGAARAPVARVARSVGARRLATTEAGSVAAMQSAREQLDRTAESARALELDEARQVAAKRPGLEQDQRAVSRALRGYEDELVHTSAAGGQPRAPRDEELALLARRERIERQLDSPELRRAEATTREADRALAREGRLTSDAERAAWREQRRRDIQAGLPLDHERNLRAAGIDPREYRSRPPEAQSELRQKARAQVERDRRQLAGLPEDGRRPTAAESGRAATAIPHEELRRRVAEQRAACQHERRVRKRRQHLYRR